MLGREIPHGALRAALNRFGFRYVRVSNSDAGKYIVDVDAARLICEKIMKRKKRVRF